MGERLADESPVDADLVLPIPDSGTPAAIGFSRATGIPFSEGLIKNRYVGRTFIQPDQEMREQGDPPEVQPARRGRGRRVVVVDDSIVRGNTTAPDRPHAPRRRRARGPRPRLLAAGDRPVLLRHRPAARTRWSPSRRTVDRSATSIGVASLDYLSLDGLTAATRRPESVLCRACFTRDYPTRVPRSRRQSSASRPFKSWAQIADPLSRIRHRLHLKAAASRPLPHRLPEALALTAPARGSPSRHRG